MSARRLSFRFRVFEQRLHSQYDFGGRDLQDFGESDKRSDRWASDAALDHAHVRAVKPAVKGQLLLGYVAAFADLTNRLAERFDRSKDRLYLFPRMLSQLNNRGILNDNRHTDDGLHF